MLLAATFILTPRISPRWLYAQGRKEEAIGILARLHSRDQDPDSPLIRFEINEIEEVSEEFMTCSCMAHAVYLSEHLPHWKRQAMVGFPPSLPDALRPLPFGHW